MLKDNSFIHYLYTMLQVSKIYVYPVKSLGGISLPVGRVTDRGFEHDRRWMLIDDQSKFISQRQFAELSLFQVSIQEAGFIVTYKPLGDWIFVPFKTSGNALEVEIWDDKCEGVEVSAKISDWFSTLLDRQCKLVFMPNDTKRKVDIDFALNNEITSFSDGYPFMMIGQSSLDDLNSRLQVPLPMNRFRPNIVFTGGAPYAEDLMTDFRISETQFFGVNHCTRCVVTTIDQEAAVRGKEPLKTLATYRSVNNKVKFGQNLLHRGEGIIKVGDVIEYS